MLGLCSILLALLSLSNIIMPTVHGLRIYKMREELFNILGNDDEGEERLYMELCEQSSNTGNCMLAIDDDVINEWTQCASSQAESYGYWKALLEAPAYVSRVVIHTVELPDAEVKNGLADFSLIAGGSECFRYISTDKFESKSIPCDALADEIIIQSYRMESVLALCEVEVYGKLVTFQGMESGEMELPFQDCDMSSQFNNFDCSHAIDRNFLQNPQLPDKKCAVTEKEEKPWWIVYLARPALVKHVKLYSRIDCCQDDQSDFHIIVNEATCAKQKSSIFVSKIFACERFGGSVKLQSQLEKNQFSMCQVQVFGHTMAVFRDSDIKYIGCYKDIKGTPDFELQVSTTWMSVKKCRKMCKRLNKAFFGLQNGHVCMCGNKYGNHGKAESEDSCSRPCSNDPNAACGGLEFNSVYEIIL